jgi:hypothetical protein
MSKIEWLNSYQHETGCGIGDARRAWDEMYARMAEDTELRDRAALAALQGFCAQADTSGTWTWLPDMAAAEAWRVADAFIAARETKEGKE